MPRAAIGLGANLGDPAEQLRRAWQQLQGLPGLQSGRCSSLYRSPPLGPATQPDYCNAVAEFHTALEPHALMQALLGIEQRFGRHRDGQRWGPRVLDLDLLWIEGVVLQEPALTLPHPGWRQRDFVLWPWAQLSPLLEPVPGDGCLIDLARACRQQGLPLWSADAQ
ncbi:MAG TPA: 2-amino-4-hydroxy-6-hydroxymethyldihydropteridine diphosphokinase [Nevskiaceae bacterium]|nr:2-amino-4-hydroxy-6-hydroxymethyldihydropteridine diphosphokinase [Nevskiaceae bacterium]